MLKSEIIKELIRNCIAKNIITREVGLNLKKVIIPTVETCLLDQITFIFANIAERRIKLPSNYCSGAQLFRRLGSGANEYFTEDNDVIYINSLHLIQWQIRAIWPSHLCL